MVVSNFSVSSDALRGVVMAAGKAGSNLCVVVKMLKKKPGQGENLLTKEQAAECLGVTVRCLELGGTRRFY